ncbi:carboxypeptidase regulatory-like domain-containing protein [Chondromyces crocatus]|uniref:PDZ domain-containing protein n=1 Tax=Chondromyces crocatus TaxID=52 RepID=A0A0K1EPX6_CHOCO|nr:carboxypeptidase regulatory-like domain-containing protein [Chondromyces crocatus]AKT42697.1 uncharacterized protein CMC5_069240 [Chondromyces crocatus]
MTKRSVAVTLAGVFLALLVGFLWFRAQRPEVDPAASPSEATSAPSTARHRLRTPRTMAQGSIAGRVTTPSGAPIHGAHVCARVEREPLHAIASMPTCVTTSEDGQYRIAPLYPARWSLFASAEKHRPRRYIPPEPAPDLEHGIALGPGEMRTGVDIALPEGGVALRGQVRDVGGGGISGALVTCTDAFGTGTSSIAATRSDAQGAFVAWVDPGPYMVKASVDGYADAWNHTEAPGPPVEIVMMPAATIAGQVIDAESGAPLTDALVDAGAEMGIAAVERVSTDQEGRFRLSRLSPGRYKPSARTDGRYGQVQTSIQLGLGQSVSDLVIQVHAASNLAGRVVIQPDKEPCSQGFVTLIGPSQETHQGRLDAEGWVRFEGMLPGTYRPLLSCEGFAGMNDQPTFELGAENRDDLEWTLQAGRTLKGRVVDEEDRPVRATVHAMTTAPLTAMPPSGFGQTDAEGRFVFRGLIPGKYEVSAQAIAQDMQKQTEVDLADRDASDVTLVLAGGSSIIEGIIVDEHQKPVVNVQIVAEDQASHRSTMARSDQDGSFALRNLKAGEFRVYATREGAMLRTPRPKLAQSPTQTASATSEPDGLMAERGVTARVKGGETTRVRLVVEAQDGEIHGRVLNDDGEPVTDAFIHAERESAGAPSGAAAAALLGRWSFTPVVTDPEGEFTLGNLSPGRYTLHAYRKGGGDASVEHIDVGQTVTLTIRKTASLSGTLTAQGGSPPAQFTISATLGGLPVRTESFFQTGGAWSLDDLSEGAYDLRATADEGTAWTQVSLASGEERNGVRIVLAPRTTVKGRLVELDSGAPIAGVALSLHANGPGAMGMAAMEPQRSDASGHFEITKVEAGKAVMMAMPPPGPTPIHDAIWLPIEVQAGTVLDLGQVAMAKRRVMPMAAPGDLGYTLPIPDPGAMFSSPPLTVASVRPDGPAATAGLATGDVIATVDGHDVTGRRSYLYRSLTTVPEGTTVTLGLAGGGRIQVTAEKSGFAMPGPGGFPVGGVPPAAVLH